MTIAIDFDGTIKRSSQFDEKEAYLWMDIVDRFSNDGHKVIIATMRYGAPIDCDEVSRYAVTWPCEVYFCGEFPDKRTAMRHFGVSVDIWIDDMPDTIGFLPVIKLPEPPTEATP